MYSNSYKTNTILKKFSLNMLKKYSERAHNHYDIDPLYKAIKITLSNLKNQEIKSFLNTEIQKAKSPYIKKGFEKAILMINRTSCV